MANGFFLGGMAEGMKTAADQQLEQDKLAQLIDYQKQSLGMTQQGLDLRKQEMGQNYDLRTRALALQAQGQHNAAQRELLSRVDAQVGQTMDLVAHTVQSLKAAGKDPDTIAQTVQPLLQSAKSLRAKGGGGDPASLDAQLSVMLAQPTPTETAVAGVNTKVQTAKAVSDATGVPQNDAFAGQGLIPKPATNEFKTITNPDFTQSAVSFNPNTGEAKPIELPQSSAANASGEKTIAGLTEPQIDMMARQLNAGNYSVLSNLGRGRVGQAAILAIRGRAASILMDEGGMTAQQAADTANQKVAEFAGMKAGAGSLGKQEAQVTGAITKAMQTAPRVLETSAAVDRTKYPSLNAIILAGKEGTGDENVVRFGVALNTFVNNYARALGGGNSQLTDSARSEASELLNKAWSKGQVAAAIDQMLNKELPSELTGAKMGMREFVMHFNNGKAQHQATQPTAPASGGVVDFRTYFGGQ